MHGLLDAAAEKAEVLAGDVRECAGVGRCDRANQVVNAVGGLAPIDASVFGFASAEIRALGQIKRRVYGGAVQQIREDGV